MPTLYDADGKPIRSAELEREHARASLTGVRSPYSSSEAAGLTPMRLTRLLRAADEGDTQAFFELAEEMEIRELHYGSVIRTRKMAVAGCTVQVEAFSDDPRDREIADALREEVIQNPAFETLLLDLMDGVAKGISLVEIMWETRSRLWAPRAYEWRDPRWFQWDRETLSEPRLRTEANSDGEELARYKWLRHEPRMKSGLPLRSGLARMASVAFMLKSFTVRDLHAFMETFGMPVRVGKYDPKITTGDEKASMLRALAGIGANASALVPIGMNVEILGQNTASNGEKLFLGAADWWDKQVSKAVLGQTMTTDSGSSRSQAEVHDEVRLDLKKADARGLQATLQRDLATPFVVLNFGPEARVPKITVVVEEPEDLKSYMETVDIAVSLGVEIEQSAVRDKIGIPDPTPGAKLLSKTKAPAPVPPGANPAPALPAPTPEPEDRSAMNRAIVQRTVVAMNRRAQDDIDRLVAEELGDWRPAAEPIGTLIEQLERADSPAAAREVLRRAATTMDLSAFTDELAAAMLKARGLGDAKDGPA